MAAAFDGLFVSAAAAAGEYRGLAPPPALAGVSAYDDAVAEFVANLEAHMATCERLGRYAEADIARQRLAEVREHELHRRKEALRSRQLAEVLAVEEAFVVEFRRFHLAWDERQAAFEAHAAMTLAQLRAKHDGELRAFQQKLLVRSAYPRHSSEYFNMRKIEEYLAKQKNFPAAAAMREKADELAAFEEGKWSEERQAELLGKESGFKGKQQLEYDTVSNRLAQRRAELSRARENELQMMLVRYNNAKNEVERQHKMEAFKLAKEVDIELKVVRGLVSKLAYG